MSYIRVGIYKCFYEPVADHGRLNTKDFYLSETRCFSCHLEHQNLFHPPHKLLYSSHILGGIGMILQNHCQ